MGRKVEEKSKRQQLREQRLRRQQRQRGSFDYCRLVNPAFASDCARSDRGNCAHYPQSASERKL